MYTIPDLLDLDGCTACPLYKEAYQPVYGDGPVPADIMLIGEAPGYNEDKQGKPFVGQAGRVLDDVLGEVGYMRRELYITNIMKHRPPKNRKPIPAEMEICGHLLWHEIEMVKPKLVVCLGASAMTPFFPKSAKVPTYRVIPPTLFVSTYHPAYFLHARRPAIKDMIIEVLNDGLHLMGLGRVRTS